VVESECGHPGVAIGRIQELRENPRRSRSRRPKGPSLLEAAIAHEVPEKPRLLLLVEEPCAGAAQRPRDEDGRQDDIHGMPLRQP